MARSAATWTQKALTPETLEYIRSMPMSGTVGIWIVGGTAFSVTADTLISETHGPAMVGAFVRVRFVEPAGSDRKIALSIETLPPPGPWVRRIVGWLRIHHNGLARGDAASTTYTVNGQPVDVTDATMIDDSAALLRDGQPVTVDLATDSVTGRTQATAITVIGSLHTVFMPAIIE